LEFFADEVPCYGEDEKFKPELEQLVEKIYVMCLNIGQMVSVSEKSNNDTDGVEAEAYGKSA
jgi:hypothetical protein